MAQRRRDVTKESSAAMLRGQTVTVRGFLEHDGKIFNNDHEVHVLHPERSVARNGGACRHESRKTRQLA